MRIQWLGHAAFKLSGAGQTIYIDPSRMDSLGPEVKRLFDHPEPADVILFTHDHPDHCNPASFGKMLKANTMLVGPQSCRSKLGAEMHMVEPGAQLTVGAATIRAVYAYNITRHRTPGTPFHPRGAGVGYLVTIEGHTVYHAGDTEPIPEMGHLGKVDVALLPVDGHYTMPPEEAMQAAATIRCGVVIPMHLFNTPGEEVVAAAREHPNVSLRLLEPGDTYDLQ
ncbi:MAG: MBL fold metallo-hydrolase [Chloroflexi bacterium]|nr:MBL fold metallo-hydrolase [Chloroflexota bacterium]